MRRSFVFSAMALGLAAVVSLMPASPSRATSIMPCEREDRKITFIVPADRVSTFQAFIRGYASQHGLRYFQPELGPEDGDLIPQSMSARDWSWGILVQTSPGSDDALARISDEPSCKKRLPRTHALAWKRFIADVEMAGYPATHSEPRFFRQ